MKSYFWIVGFSTYSRAISNHKFLTTFRTLRIDEFSIFSCSPTRLRWKSNPATRRALKLKVKANGSRLTRNHWRQSAAKHAEADNKQIPAKENWPETQRASNARRVFLAQSVSALQESARRKNQCDHETRAKRGTGVEKKSDERGKRQPFELLFISRLETDQPGEKERKKKNERERERERKKKELRRAGHRRGKRKDGWSQGKASAIILLLLPLPPPSYCLWISYPFVQGRPVRSDVAV